MKTLTATALLAMMMATPAFADDDIREIRAYTQQLGLISVEEATAIALEAKPGVIDDIDLENRKFGQGWDYEFEIIDADGVEWEVYINAKTGEVRKIERDWF